MKELKGVKVGLRGLGMRGDDTYGWGKRRAYMTPETGHMSLSSGFTIYACLYKTGNSIFGYGHCQGLVSIDATSNRFKQ